MYVCMYVCVCVCVCVQMRTHVCMHVSGHDEQRCQINRNLMHRGKKAVIL